MVNSPCGANRYVFSGTVRRTWTSRFPAAGGSTGGASCSPVTSFQRRLKCAATSTTAGPRRRTAASCQPSEVRGGCEDASCRSPCSAVKSIPPTNAVVPSTTTIFSWWQCIVRSRRSRAHCTRLSRTNSSRA